MKAYLILLLAIVLETIATSFLKQSCLLYTSDAADE